MIVGLRNSGMRDRHWQRVSVLAGTTVNPEMEEFTLSKLRVLGLIKHVDALVDIGDRSGKELASESQLKHLQAAWQNDEFDCSEPDRGTPGVRRRRPPDRGARSKKPQKSARASTLWLAPTRVLELPVSYYSRWETATSPSKNWFRN